MRTSLRLTVLTVCAAGAIACLGTTQAELRIDVPPVLPLVTVEPGVQVVEDYGEEIFFVDGYYWVRRGGYWYRAGDPRARWVYVEPRVVPAVIVRSPPGRYVHWRHDRRVGEERRGEGRHDERGEHDRGG